MRRLARFAPLRPVLWLMAALWLSTAWLSTAGAHGEADSDLRGVTLCLDGQTVQVDLEGVQVGRAASARAQITAALGQHLTAALAQDGVRSVRRASCAGQVGHTQLQASVRYLDPRSYIGHGQNTYSYTVLLRVNAARTPVSGQRRGFSSGWSDLYSETGTRQPFEAVVSKWGEEQSRDLTALWRRDNPTLPKRLTQPGPLRSALLAAAFAIMLISAGVLVAVYRRSGKKLTG